MIDFSHVMTDQTHQNPGLFINEWIKGFNLEMQR